ncbi:restriction endonuclease [Streptomyces sp. NBC_00984]|uniref:restriction endonuclease n=1 Tax=Streptomyces sp. NBC_00984 TaxID=2903700 RepID=UPI00386C6E1E|nr:restriction endonuclease [Streptomyces sp. NBC_00984]
MINEVALVESQAQRQSFTERTEALDRVKVLSLLPNGLHVTTAMVAAYFEVAETVINNLLSRHREELESNGLRVIRGNELQKFKKLTLSSYPESYPQPRSSMALWLRRTVLNVAMLLRDSDVARRVRTYLLDLEHTFRAQPTVVDAPGHDSDVESLDARITRLSEESFTRLLGSTVVPMLSALIETSGEQQRELVSLRENVQQIERRLVRHDVQLRRLQRAQERRPLVGVMAAMDAMNWREFEQHIAGLLRRDDCTDVEVHGGSGDRGADITAYTADGRRLVVQCKNFAPYRSVWSGEMQKFVGTKTLHRADVAVYVATCPFSRETLDIAMRAGVTAVHRGLLEAWSAGAKLQVLK